jgi:hypothetical protein
MDRRYNGHETFSHRIEFSGAGRVEQFLRSRNWCIEKFGASAEIFMFNNQVFATTPFWAWESEHSLVIYLRDAALSQYLFVKETFE